MAAIPLSRSRRSDFPMQCSLLSDVNERGMFLIMTMQLELLCGIAANAFSEQLPCPVKGVVLYG
ncbi:MAG: hypothetical protein Q8K68_01715 [Nitrospirota bacterium]|nr:hypothetical protein [Nitrospirota bacterium]